MTKNNSYRQILEVANAHNAQLIAVSKMQPESRILALYEAGQKDFGENYVQELVHKYEQLPTDIRWHFIGHLQSNKVKYIAPFVHLIHGVDRISLLKEINKQALRHNRIIDCLLQVHIADEESKFGFNPEDLPAVFAEGELASRYENVRIKGFMGMATFTDDTDKIRSEFARLKKLFDQYFSSSGGNLEQDNAPILSMGMSADYKIALEEGSNMLRIGSLLFGARQ